jgi:uncharacterized protein (DUF2235 family)
MTKAIVIFSDGTGQEGGKVRKGAQHSGGADNTNVYKLFNMLEVRTAAQIAFYDRGLGTGWRKITGNAMGAGIEKNILECYQFLSDHYHVGDRIFLFGFSRGATTVRSLAGFICLFGMLPHSRPDLAKQAWKIYKNTNPRRRNKKALEFLQRNNTTYCNIEFLGVWDTVRALGVPIRAVNYVLNKIPMFNTSFHDLQVPYCVHHAYQALAIDEDREIFSPEIWLQPTTERNPEPRLIPPDLRQIPIDELDAWFANHKPPNTKDIEQTIRQVWFCGVHTDVGGGYKEHGVSDIPLLWMLNKARQHGLKVYPFSGVDLSPDVEDVIHDSMATSTDKFLFQRKQRCWDTERYGAPIIHASVLDREGGWLGRVQTGVPLRKGDDIPISVIPYAPWILDPGRGGFMAGEYQIEPLDDEIFFMSIEHKYRSEYTGRL